MDLVEMLEAADHFDMEEMKEDIYCKVFDDIKPTNVLTIGNLADTFNAKQLLLACVFLHRVHQGGGGGKPRAGGGAARRGEEEERGAAQRAPPREGGGEGEDRGEL